MNSICRLALAFLSGLLLLGVIGANTASASEFEAESYPASLEGGQVEGEPLVLETEAGTLECTTVTATGEQTETSESVELALTTSECKAFGFVGAGIHFNECTLRFRGGGSLAEDKFEGTIDIVCPANKSIKVTAGTCEFDIPGQNGITGLGLDIETSLFNPAIKFTFGAGITINVTKDGFLCPFSGTGHKSGAWTGSLTVSAFDVFKQIIKWILKK